MGNSDIYFITCAVCGKTLNGDGGDGMKIPKTLCLSCYKKRIKQNKIDKEEEKTKEKERLKIKK